VVQALPFARAKVTILVRMGIRIAFSPCGRKAVAA
jgi:hypothetical protein